MCRHCYRRKGLKTSDCWGEWKDSHWHHWNFDPTQKKEKAKGKESCSFLLESSQTKERKKRIMNVYKLPKIMAALFFFLIYRSSFLWQQSFFFLLAILIKIKKKSSSDNIQISKHTTRDALFNSKTTTYKVSWIFSGTAHQLRPLMGG